MVDPKQPVEIEISIVVTVSTVGVLTDVSLKAWRCKRVDWSVNLLF